VGDYRIEYYPLRTEILLLFYQPIVSQEQHDLRQEPELNRTVVWDRNEPVSARKGKKEKQMNKEQTFI
jgi:hypothetical protein